MPGDPNPVREITGLSSSGDMSDVSKGQFIAWGEGRVAQILADASEVLARDLAEQSAILLLSTGRIYVKNTETTDAISATLVRDANGIAFVQVPNAAVTINASGDFSDLDDYDDEIAGFVYLSLDGDGGAIEDAVLFIKQTDTSGDWSSPVLLRGERGGDRYEISNWDTDRPASGEELIAHLFTTYAEFAIAFAGSRAKALVASTGSAVYSIQKNGVQIGTLTFSSGNVVGAFALASATAFAAGDRFSVIAPNPRDATLSGVTMTIVADRN